MKIIMKASLSGTRNGRAWPSVGETADVTAGEAHDMIATGLASPAEVAEPPAPETATARKPSTRKKS